MAGIWGSYPANNQCFFPQVGCLPYQASPEKAASTADLANPANLANLANPANPASLANAAHLANAAYLANVGNPTNPANLANPFLLPHNAVGGAQSPPDPLSYFVEPQLSIACPPVSAPPSQTDAVQALLPSAANVGAAVPTVDGRCADACNDRAHSIKAELAEAMSAIEALKAECAETVSGVGAAHTRHVESEHRLQILEAELCRSKERQEELQLRYELEIAELKEELARVRDANVIRLDERTANLASMIEESISTMHEWYEKLKDASNYDY